MRWFRNRERDPATQRDPQRDPKGGATPRPARPTPYGGAQPGERMDRAQNQPSATHQTGRAPKPPSIPPQRSLWLTIVPAVTNTRPVCLLASGFHHHGRLTAVRINADGSADVRFSDGVTGVVTAQRTIRRTS